MSQQGYQPPEFPQAAYEVLVGRVHRPYFLEKLAREWGVVPQNQQEEVQLLELAGMLREAKEQEMAKSAAAGGNSFLAEASDSLKGAMSQLGYGELPTSYDRLVKSSAAGLAQDPEINQATLEFGNYLASL